MHVSSANRTVVPRSGVSINQPDQFVNVFDLGILQNAFAIMMHLQCSASQPSLPDPIMEKTQRTSSSRHTEDGEQKGWNSLLGNLNQAMSYFTVVVAYPRPPLISSHRCHRQNLRWTLTSKLSSIQTLSKINDAISDKGAYERLLLRTMLPLTNNRSTVIRMQELTTKRIVSRLCLVHMFHRRTSRQVCVCMANTRACHFESSSEWKPESHLPVSVWCSFISIAQWGRNLFPSWKYLSQNKFGKLHWDLQRSILNVVLQSSWYDVTEHAVIWSSLKSCNSLKPIRTLGESNPNLKEEVFDVLAPMKAILQGIFIRLQLKGRKFEISKAASELQWMKCGETSMLLMIQSL